MRKLYKINRLHINYGSDGFTNDETRKHTQTHTHTHTHAHTHKKRKLNCEHVKRDFLAKQAMFDREVKKTKRRWQRNKVLELDKANVDDPTAFWEFIKCLRSSKK